MFTQERILNHPGEAHGPLKDGLMYEYLIAGNGTFIHAERPGLKAVIPEAGRMIGTSGPHIVPYVQVMPKFSGWLLDAALNAACERDGIDSLFALWPQRLLVPAQEACAGTVRPVDPYDTIMADTMCDLHSHHHMEARFSPTDDKEEAGFRIYAVIGRIYTLPEIRVRVGIYGHMWEIPALTVFDRLGRFKDALS
jgi:hypothetical protein